MAQFEVVRDDAPAPPRAAPDNSAATTALIIALKALGQRFIIALSNLFCLITVLSVFWLGLSIIHEPTTPQLIGLGMYALFILAINIIVRRA
jgi:hypothetical protein